MTSTDALLQATSYSYDAAGNKLSQTDANGHTTRWSYDALDRVQTRTLPLGQSETFSYDANGNMLSHTDFEAQGCANAAGAGCAGAANGPTTLAYDVNNRLIGKTYADASTETMTYDAVGNRLSATDSRGTTRYAYDNRDRLISETQP